MKTHESPRPRAGRSPRLVLASSLAAVAIACGIRTPLTDGLDQAVPPAKDAGPLQPGAPAPPDASAPFPGFPPQDAAAPDASNPDADRPVRDAGLLADVALPTTDLGNVLLTSGAYASGSIQTLVATAAFYPSVAPTGCSISPVAGCTLETCPVPTGAPVGLTTAGAITVTGGFYPLLLEPSGSGQYAPTADGGSLTLWRGGERLDVTSSGGVVPAFSAWVLAPTQLTILTPQPSVVSRAQPFALSWFGASEGKLAVDLSTQLGATDYYLECQLDVGAGAGEVPAEALRTLPTGAGGLTVLTISESVVGDGPWRIETFAQTNANDSQGREYEVTVQLE